jgi:hypothetical protein
MQKNGDQRGHHRHMQKRPFMKSKTKGQPALSAANDVAGFFVVIIPTVVYPQSPHALIVA